MKNLNKAIFIALGMALPLGVMASPDDDVTIRMMEVNEQAVEAVTSQIELPDVADDHAKENAEKGLNVANSARSGDSDQERDHEMDTEGMDKEDMDKESMDKGERDQEMDREDDHERDMDREDEHERDMDTERDDRKDVDRGGMDREEVEREGLNSIDHGRDNAVADFEAPDQAIESNIEQSAH